AGCERSSISERGARTEPKDKKQTKHEKKNYHVEHRVGTRRGESRLSTGQGTGRARTETRRTGPASHDGQSVRSSDEGPESDGRTKNQGPADHRPDQAADRRHP